MFTYQYKLNIDLLTKEAIHISSLLNNYNCTIFIYKNNIKINPKSSVDLITSNLQKNDIIDISIDNLKYKLDILKIFNLIGDEINV